MNQLINCCSDMSTIVFSDQSSVFFISISVGGHQVWPHPARKDLSKTQDSTKSVIDG